MELSTREKVVAYAVLLSPLAAYVLIRLVAIRRGWTGRFALRLLAYFTWLSWATWIAIGSQRDALGYAFVFVFVGVIWGAIFKFFAWARRDELDADDKYIAEQSQRWRKAKSV
jgi:uncharacterized membrane protein